jgi:phosphinothricin acetyltransferase
MTTIRRARAEDAAACADIYEPYVVDSGVSFEQTPPGAAAMTDRIAETLETYPWLVAVDGETVLGFGYASDHRSRGAYQWSVELSIYVGEDSRRSGVATGLYESLFAVLRRQGFVNAYAGVTLPNPASVAFHREMGFEPVGTYENVGYTADEWQDVQWWHRGLREPESGPDDPVPLAEFEDTARLEASIETGASAIML